MFYNILYQHTFIAFAGCGAGYPKQTDFFIFFDPVRPSVFYKNCSVFGLFYKFIPVYF